MTMQETETIVFIDSNIVFYALGNDEEKRSSHPNLLTTLPALYISIQVIRRKLKYSPV